MATAAAQPAQQQCWCDQQDIGAPGVSCGDCPTRDYKQPAHAPAVWKTQFFTDVVTAAGLLAYGKTDKKLADRIAQTAYKWRKELFAPPTQPALSDGECSNLVEQAIANYAKLKNIPIEHLNTDLREMPTLAVFIARAIEAHCRGGVK